MPPNSNHPPISFFPELEVRYENVCLEAFAYTLPDQVVSSDQIERWLEPVYSRLRLPEGRLELMTGITERRFWPRGMLPGEKSVETGQKAIELAGLDRGHVGALIHGSVCRDFLEPATASGVHHRLGLPSNCTLFDVSNACLGLVNGMVQVANMIELGQIRAGIVVGTESSRSLVETTIHQLNEDTSLTRQDVKLALASLTIGSGSAAVVLTDRQLSRTGNRFLGGIAHANTGFSHLCQSSRDESGGDEMHPLMSTDSEALMQQGVRTAREAFARFLDEVGWDASGIDKTFCHQVGRAHQKLLFDSLDLNPAIDYPTIGWLGNTGSVAMPITAGLGLESGHVSPGERLTLLGIGSGISVVMLGVEWQKSLVASTAPLAGPHSARAGASLESGKS